MRISSPATTPLVVPPVRAHPARPALAPVDVRPLEPHVRGTITLAAPDKDGRTFVSAASGLVASGGSAWVVSDELGELVHVAQPAASPMRGTLVAGLPRQPKKPDFEAVTTVPGALAGLQGTALLALGSGSSEVRNRGVLHLLGAGGAPAGPSRTIDLSALYAELDRRLPLQPNIEGATMRQGAAGAELLLLHRGKAAGDVNTIFVLDAASALGAAGRTGSIPASAIRSQHVVDLGTLGGERLGFADARALPDGRIAFVASAEGGAGTGDGTIRGSVLGVLDARFGVVALRPLTGAPRKVEGIERTAELQPGAGPSSFTLVTDPDDPERGTEVLTVDLG